MYEIRVLQLDTRDAAAADASLAGPINSARIVRVLRPR
jgi:hypothetical protein